MLSGEIMPLGRSADSGVGLRIRLFRIECVYQLPASPEAPCTHEVLPVVAFGQARVGGGSTGTRRVNETTIACVDANVIDAAADDVESGTEKHSISR